MIKTKRKVKNSARNIVKSIRLNKSNEIRKVAEQMSKKGVDAKGCLIAKVLAKRKIKVSASHISYALDRKSKRKKINCSVDDLVLVRDFIKQIGGIARAEIAIKVYKKFKNG